jgi:hypothetical protein
MPMDGEQQDPVMKKKTHAKPPNLPGYMFITGGKVLTDTRTTRGNLSYTHNPSYPTNLNGLHNP